MKLRLFLLSLVGGLLTTFAADDAAIEINKETDISKLIPLSVSGYSGEVASTLRFDLEVAGFRLVSANDADYVLTGGNSGQVEGRLMDKLKNANLLAKAYTGGTARSQAHALADDVVQAITGKPGIARTKIVFKVEAGKIKDRAQVSELYVADYDGGGAVQVTSDDTIVAAPAWGPGRKMLYYTSYRSRYPDIYSHDLQSGERKAIARYPGLNTSAAVSPDGSKVAMILSKGGNPDLYVANADGTGLVQLTKTREGESSPCWSPDGRTICYSSREGRWALYTIPASGGSPTRLRTDGAPNPTEPDWSPDGKTIVFTSQMRDFQICTVPATGGEARVIAAGEDPSWGPNSRTVVFAQRIGGKRVLSLLDVPSKRVKHVPLKLVGSCSQPSWAR